MAVSGVAKRYARAFFKLSSASVAEARKHLESLAAINALFDIETAHRFLSSPVMPIETKKKLLSYGLSTVKKDELTEKFVMSVVDEGRVALLPEIIEGFIELIDEKEGFLRLDVTSATPLDESLKNSIAQGFSSTAKVELKTHIDPTILGGLVIRNGNKLIDLSLRARLNQITSEAIS